MPILRKVPLIKIEEIPDTFTIEIDTREKKPLQFPETFSFYKGGIGCAQYQQSVQEFHIKQERKCLLAGDYRIKELEDLIGIERKGSVGELGSCFLGYPSRLQEIRKFENLISTYVCPAVLLDIPPWHLSSGVQSHAPFLSEQIADIVFQTLMRAGIPWLICGSVNRTSSRRLQLGELVLRWMLHLIVSVPMISQEESDDTVMF